MNLVLMGGSITTLSGTIEGSAIIINGDTILEIGKLSDIIIPDDSMVIDVSGRRIISGSIELPDDSSREEKVLPFDQKSGGIAAGNQADIIVIDEKQTIELTIQKGQIFYRQKD
jgi:N-acetylglucosamine-6-phosphate deacetylase